MNDIQLGAAEERFAEIIWENEPLSSAELCRRAESVLGWKKSTVYTVLRRLCEKGIAANEHGTVTALISRAELDTVRSEQVVFESFSGSLPAFIAAFTRKNKLTQDEVNEIRRMIAEHEE